MSIKDHKSLKSEGPLEPSMQPEQVDLLQQAEELEDVAAENDGDIQLPAGAAPCMEEEVKHDRE